MMKKILYIIGILMFSTAFFSPLLSHTVLGAENGASESGDTSCKFWLNNVSCYMNLPDANWDEVFGDEDPEKAGQDLYSNIYKMTKVDPKRKAAKNITGKFGSTETDMVRILNNDFGPLLDKYPYMTQEEAITKMAEIQQKYQEEADILSMQDRKSVV